MFPLYLHFKEAFIMTTGDIATWVIFAIIVVLFCFGLRRVYRNFSSGKCDSCGMGSSCCSGGCHCCDSMEKKAENGKKDA